MIHKFINSLHNLSIYTKVAIGIVLFTVLLGAIERYQLSANIVNQFFEAKKEKNLLLVNTIEPILGFNIALGLDDANKEYLEYIKEKNPDITYIELRSKDGQILFKSHDKHEMIEHKKREFIDYCDDAILDSVTQKTLATLHLHFSNKDYETLHNKNKLLTLKLSIISLIALFIFMRILKNEFKNLQELSESVLSYDPKLNNITLQPSNRKDEVGIIQNAIISMVERIASYTKILDETNLTLEEKIKERTKELEEANKQLKALSITDGLTQLSNRRYFEEHFHQTWELARRNGVVISLIMCDIDFFKKVNDIYGHQVGDEVLKVVAHTLKISLQRNSDFVARYGGEEFIIVMYETDAKDAENVCKRIQSNLKLNQTSALKATGVHTITMSFGISSIIPKKDDSSEIFLKQADNALYKAKENGRNCVITHPN